MSEISCRITNTFIHYVKGHKPESLPYLLKDLPYDERYLLNTDNWISWDTERTLEERLAHIFDDDMIMFEIGKSVVANKSVGIVNILFNLFTSPERVVRYMPKITKYFTKGLGHINVIETSKEGATIEFIIKGKQTRGACLYNQGMFSIFTVLFGLDPAEVYEPQCVVPIDEISTFQGRSYSVDNGRVISRDRNNGGSVITHELPDDGTFSINGTTFGAASCIYRLKWGKKINSFKRKTAGKKKALEEAMVHLEQNYNKLQLAYEHLRKSESNYRQLMENASDIICFFDREGTITSLNKKGTELTGYTVGEIVGKHFLPFIVDQYRRAARVRFRKAFNKATAPFELIVRKKNGDSLILSANSSAIMEGNKTVGLMIIARDITKEKEIAARLLEAEKFAAKGLVAGEIAHEINNSLANIETALFIVNNIRTDIRYREDIFKDMKDEIERMSGIVKGILEVYHKDESAIQSVDVNREISKVISMTKRRLHGRSISVESKLSGDLSSIPCYPGHIKQILLNLIKNAEDAMASSRKKQITISSFQENGAIKLKVSDTGTGIPSDIQDKIFTTLYTSKANGYGFGLSICKQIVKKYNGSITVESEEGKGTTINVSFPVEDHA